MFPFDILSNIASQAGIMLVSALSVYALVEIAKTFIKGETWKTYVPFGIYALAFAVYLIIAKAKGYAMPIPTALANALLMLVLESSAFVIIKGVGKGIKMFVDWLKEHIGK